MKINKIILALLGVLLFGLSIYSNNLSGIVLTNESIYDNIESNLKRSGFWNLTGTPIFIDGEATGIGAHNWTWAESQDWCSGSGNWTDPYVIENITINGQGVGSCIDIRNSDAYFIIKNCTVYNSGINVGDAGITLSHANNGKLIDNNCSNNYHYGIYIDYSNNNTLSGNTLNNNHYGIYIDYSNNNTLSGNTLNNSNYYGIILSSSNDTIISGNIISNNSNLGIYLYFSRSATLTGNVIKLGGITLYGSREELTSHIIDDTNLVNNKPIYYYANKVGLKPYNFSNAGQIILINCNDSLISDVNISNVYYGIYIDYSNNCTLSENILEKNYAGIYMDYSSNATLSGNTINDNSEWGIYVDYSNNTIISGNTVNNDKNGIYNGHSSNATISGNIVSNCSYGGIGFFYSYNSIMWWNTAINNGIGIGSQNSYNITFWMNTVDNNNNIGIYLSSSSNNNLSGNIIRNNKQYGANIFGGIQSTKNLFFNNSFLNNSVHASDDGVNNHWNNSIIGNYWDNYTGIDADHDGIGDTPYNFHGGTDYLPIVDNIAPSIIIKSPTEFEVFGEAAPNFVISIDEPNLDKVWYSLNGGTNVTFTGLTGTVNQTLWDALPEGNVVIKFYANDSAGNIGFSEVTIRKDINAPIITINNPQNNDVIGATPPNFDISIDEPNLDKVWYSLNGGTNITFTGLTGTVNQTLWDALHEGNVVVKFYAIDTLRRIGFQEVTIKKDVTAPIIAINDPQNYIVIGATAPNFNITIDEQNLDKVWYSLNGGTNVTFTGLTGTINQALWDALSEGNVVIKFYANDTLGRMGFQEVTVVKEILQTSPPGISGYDILFLLGIISIVAVIIIKKRVHNLN